MRIAIVGAGALGAVYGVRLAAAGNTVTFVVREARAKAAPKLELKRIDGDEEGHLLDAPLYATSVPADADVVLVTVRQNQLDDELVKLLVPSTQAVCVLTPMFPDDFTRLEGALGRRVFPTMPSVVSYEKNGVIRYWLPRSATTQIESENGAPALLGLANALAKAGISATLKKDVLAENVATMVSFMPIAFALDAAGGVDALLADDDLVDLAIDGVKEATELAKRIGKPATWAGLLLHFVGKLTLRTGVAIAKRRSPEAVFYVEEHFGRKLHAQNVAMAEWMARAAAQHGVEDEQLRALCTRLEQVRA